MLGTQLNDGPLEEIPDVIAFTLGRELGRIRLGHTNWVNEALLALAAGREILSRLNVAEYLKQVQEPLDWWGWLSNLLREEPQITHRIKALYDAGLFELPGDLRRFSAESAAGVDPAMTAR